ncbi:MAG TPA: phosphodiester glycosidase family protein, partial [Acidimicrobiia bacterium]|nr:phosphodiester glycosidase family protein [Acidimicrobiia bacterium]
MRRAVPVLLALAVVVTGPVAARSATPPDGFAVVATKQLHTGVEYVKLSKAKAPVIAHVAHILPGAPVELQLVNAFDRISTRPSELEKTSSMCERTRCIVGVNGDFHKIGVPAGAVIVDGRMLHSPEIDRPQLTVLKDGRLVGGPFPWTGALTGPAGIHVPISTVNAAPPGNGLAVFTPEYGPTTPDSARAELVVRAARVGALNQPAIIELVSLRTGAGPIPDDGAVLSGDGSAGQQLRDLWARRQASGPPARIVISSPLDAEVSLGVEPVVLRDGKRALPWRDPNVINPRQPHTLVGWNREGHVYLVAVDGRQAASEGVTMAEAADFLVSLGVTEAVSLDGGGGTTFVSGGSVWNRPSDNDPARPGGYAERGATNALVVTPLRGRPAPSVAPVVTTAPKAIKPMAAPRETDRRSDESNLGPTWIAGPMTVEGDAPLTGPGAEAAPAGEAQLHFAGPSGTGAAPGREPVPNTAGDGAAAPEDRSLVTQARPRSKPDGDRPASEEEEAQSAPPTAGEQAGPPPVEKSSGGNGRGLLRTILGGSALAAIGVATRARAGRRTAESVPATEEVRKGNVPVEPDVLLEPHALLEAEVLSEPEVQLERRVLSEPEVVVLHEPKMLQPAVVPEPATVPEPEAALEPESLVEPEILPEPQAALEPEVLSEPEDLPKPEAVPEPEDLPEPEAVPEPEDLPEP